eukprot:1344858-Amorphochlora_amoeboformis.AAC.1
MCWDLGIRVLGNMLSQSNCLMYIVSRITEPVGTLLQLSKSLYRCYYVFFLPSGTYFRLPKALISY